VVRFNPKEVVMSALTRLTALCAVATGLSTAALAADDWQQQVAKALGKPGIEAPGGVYRVGLPRTDIKATLDGVELKPGFALGSWLAFNHMLDDQPHLFFMHFWANDDAEKLARGLKAALAEVNIAKS
jgi:hypothetical protein